MKLLSNVFAIVGTTCVIVLTIAGTTKLISLMF